MAHVPRKERKVYMKKHLCFVKTYYKGYLCSLCVGKTKISQINPKKI